MASKRLDRGEVVPVSRPLAEYIEPTEERIVAAALQLVR